MCMFEWFACPAKDGLVSSFEFTWRTKTLTQMHIRVLVSIERDTVVKNRTLNATSYGCDCGSSNS